MRDDLGREWEHAESPWFDTTYWLPADDPGGDPESWAKVAGNYGPVTLVVPNKTSP